MDKVSIIVPIYNVLEYLERCINSLFQQKYKNIEIILVDDCSTDGSRELAQKLAKKDSRCIFIQREKNGGLSAARNTGMKVASGEWLAFVDSDDWVTEDYISAMYDVAKKDDADIVMSSIYYYYENGSYKEVSPFADLTTKSSQREKIALCRPYAVTRLFRKTFIKNSMLEFPTNVWRAAEQGFIIPLLTKTEKISILHKPMYYYFQRKNSNSNKNHQNIDITFYPKSIENVIKNSEKGYEIELEYRSICDLMYGMIMIMLRSKKSNDEILEVISSFNKKYPHWKKNIYLKKLAKGKRIFILCASYKWLKVLMLLIWCWDKKESSIKKYKIKEK